MEGKGGELEKGSWQSKMMMTEEGQVAGWGNCWALALGIWTSNYLQTTAVEWWSIHLANVRNSQGKCCAKFDRADLSVEPLALIWAGVRGNEKTHVLVMPEIYITF